MSVFVINTSSGAFFKQRTQLDGVAYGLRFQYNALEKCYYLSISDGTTGVDILSGIKIVNGYGLIRRYGGMAGVPPGEFVALSNTSDDTNASIGELGPKARVTLYYADSASVP